MVEDEPFQFGGDFGSDPPDDPPAVSGESNVIPFPRMRPSVKLTELWSQAVQSHNKKHESAYRFPPAVDAIDDLIRVRGMSPMQWPPEWQETARRCRVYPRDMVGIVGSQGGGKTSFALQTCLAAAGGGTPTVWAPLELNQAQILTRAIGNVHGVHAATVRDQWSRERIAHSAASFTDLFHFVDRFRDPDKQLAAMRAAVTVAWEIYRVPPILVVDHIGKLFLNSRDPNVGAANALEALREITEELDCITLALSQGSRGNQAVLTGKVDLDSAADGMGVAANARAFEEDCSYVIALAVFKVDTEAGHEPADLDSHVLFTKCRHTGLEGRVGFRFHKPGGQWRELSHLPPTPSKVKAEQERDKRDKHRSAPPRSAGEVRADVNIAAAGDAAAMRRAKITEAIRRHGAMGIADVDLRRVPGVGRGALFRQSLQELVLASVVERINNRWRAITRTE